MEKTIGRGIFFAVLAAALYAINSPFSKILLDFMPSTLMAGFLYIGAGLGMGAVALVQGTRCGKEGGKADGERIAVHGRNDPPGYSGADLPFARASQ